MLRKQNRWKFVKNWMMGGWGRGLSGTSISDFQCVCLEVPYSNIENTEREAGFPEQRSRVLNIEMWCYELNCDPPPKKRYIGDLWHLRMWPYLERPLYRGNRVKIKSWMRALIQYGWCSCKKGTSGMEDRWQEETRGQGNSPQAKESSLQQIPPSQP